MNAALLAATILLVPPNVPKPPHYLSLGRAERAITREIALDRPRSYRIWRCSRRTRSVIQCHVDEYGTRQLLTDDGVPVAVDISELVRVKLHRHGHISIWWSL